ncbi:MAG TPA: hypothetical protein DCR40_13230 [Prolixibacteraceae bacterium]|nr:hypothetical protein [Prolixibacteraceae bacterium]
MQSNQVKSDSVTSILNLNPAFLETNTFKSGHGFIPDNLQDSTVLDSINASFIAPDSIIFFGRKLEWSQFRKAYNPVFDYQKKLIQPIPYDSLHTVLDKVEVVFPGKKVFRSNPDWLIGVLVLSIILFASVRLIFNKYLSQLIQATTSYSTFTRLFRERYFNLFHASFRLDVIFSLVMALFFYQLLNNFKINMGFSQSSSIYLTCLLIVTGYFIAKKLIYYILGVLTESTSEVNEYLFSITVFNRVLGLFLLPVTATIAFVPLRQVEPVMVAGLILIAFFYFMSLIRGGKIFLKKHFSISYLILYLCTLEFLPLLLIYYLLLI